MSRLHWQLTGPAGAPVLVLLNSLGASSQMWRYQLGPLAERLRVVEVDARGHGRSPAAAPGETGNLASVAADVLEVLDEVQAGTGAPRVHLAGLSLGGMTAMWLAARYPERVGRLALLCTSAYLPPAEQWTDRAATVRREGTAAIAEATAARWVTAGLIERDPAVRDWIIGMLDETDDEGYAQCAEAVATMDLRADLARISAPTLVIAGAQDPSTPPEHGRLIAAGIAGARLQVLDPASHLATVEAAGAITTLLLEHFSPAADLLDAGHRTRRAVLGDSHVDRAQAQSDEFSRPFQDFLTRYAWGEVWSRPDLDRRQRSIATLAALVTLGAEHELGLHVEAALRNGLSPAEIREVLLHTALYAGLPRTNRAFAVAADILAAVASAGPDDPPPASAG